MRKDMNGYSGKTKKIIALLGVALFLLLSAVVFLRVGKPMIRFASEPEKFRAFIEREGIFGKVLFIGMTVLQVVVAVIPGEPLEIAAGYAFGAVEGTVLCLLGITIGSAVVFLLVRTLGRRVVEIFFSREKIDAIERFQKSRRFAPAVFLVFTMPGTPKDVLTYFAGLTQIKFTTWMILTPLTRFPSVVTSTVGGDAIGIGNYKFAFLVFGLTLLVSGVGYVVYNKIMARKEK